MTEFPRRTVRPGRRRLAQRKRSRLQVHLYSAGYLSGQHSHDQCRHQRYAAGNHFLPMVHTSRWRSADGFQRRFIPHRRFCNRHVLCGRLSGALSLSVHRTGGCDDGLVHAPSGCTGQSLSFSGTGTSSMSTISGYSWNFGDGSPASNSQNTTHTYSSSGNYTVTLTVTNASGCTMTSTQTVAVSAPPVISVSPSVTSGCGPLSVNFSNSTTGATGYTWNFGDGSPTSSSTSPTHVYTSNGTYTVTMTATNASGCSATYTGTNLISVANGPTASFSNATPSICLGDTIRFTNLSTANGTPISGYSWDFDDGTPASTQTSPTHIYTSPGTYAVTLTTSAGVCSDDTTINVTVNPAPVAAFTAPRPRAAAAWPLPSTTPRQDRRSTPGISATAPRAR